ncbi:MAG: hypothetical protein WAV13_10985 [Thermodesulfovibrionales bacterium]
MRFVLTTQPGIELLLPYNEYTEFLNVKYKERCELDEIKVEVLFSRPVDTSGMKILFEAEQSWSVLSDGNHYFIKFEGQDSDGFQMLLRFDSGMKDLILYCSPDLLNAEGNAVSPFHYPLDQILLMLYLSMRNGLIVHSAGFSLNGRGYLFPGRSGAGKSTLSRKLLENKRIECFSDDRIIIRKTEGPFKMFGTPWPGEAGIAVNKSDILSGIFFLVQGMENRVEKVTCSEAFSRFMPVLSIPWFDQDAINRCFSIVEQLISEVPSYVLYFNPEIRVEDIFEEFARV